MLKPYSTQPLHRQPPTTTAAKESMIMMIVTKANGLNAAIENDTETAHGIVRETASDVIGAEKGGGIKMEMMA